MYPMWLLCLVCVSIATPALGSGEAARAVRTAMIPGGVSVAVVAEGDFEPRSIGSYSVRVYSGANPDFPYDDFVAGVVNRRIGTIEALEFADLNHDDKPEIIVITRSVSSGGYVSADAFQLQGRVLARLATVSGLAKGADPIRYLEAELENGAEARK